MTHKNQECSREETGICDCVKCLGYDSWEEYATAKPRHELPPVRPDKILDFLGGLYDNQVDTVEGFIVHDDEKDAECYLSNEDGIFDWVARPKDATVFEDKSVAEGVIKEFGYRSLRLVHVCRTSSVTVVEV